MHLSGEGEVVDIPTMLTAAWDFSMESLSFVSKDSFEVAEISGLTTVLTDRIRAGLPCLPVLTAQLLLPRDRKIRDVTYHTIAEPLGPSQHLLYPVQIEGTLDGGPQPPFVPPEPAAYSSPVPYRQRLVEVVHETWHRGYRIATVNVYPLQFVGATSTVILNTRIAATFTLERMTDEELGQMAPKLRPDSRPSFSEGIRRRMTRRLVNPDALTRFYGEIDAPRGRQAYGGFTPSEMPSLDSPPVEYVIVTSDELADSFRPLADWKTISGFPAVVRTVDWIEARYPGVDTQERIRNFIRNAFAKWGTNYVLLGGDTEVVPDRFFYSTSIYFQDPPVDFYYAALDGTWNNNGNSYFGESYGDGEDLRHEVMVARAPVNTPQEATTFVDKVLTYSHAPGSSEIDGSHYNSLLLLGGSTNGWQDNFSNGIYVAESIEDTVSTTAIESGTSSPTVKRLYENVFLDHDGPCRSAAGDSCQDRVGFRSIRCAKFTSNQTISPNIEICTGNFSGDQFELSVTQQSGVTLSNGQGSGGEWVFRPDLSDNLRLTWTRSSPMPSLICEGRGITIAFSAQRPNLKCNSEVTITEKWWNQGTPVGQTTQEHTFGQCPPSEDDWTALRSFLCSRADSTAVFNESRGPDGRGEFNEAGIIRELNRGYGYVFHQEHSYTDRLGGPSNSDGWGPWCIKDPDQPRALTRGVVPQIDSGHEYGIFYSIGSYQNSVDKDAVSEALMRVPRGGAVAYLAKQRSAHNEMQRWVGRDFFVNCFDQVKFADLGSAAYDAMETGGNNRPTRESTVEQLLLGDPGMPVFSAAPVALALSGSGLNQITSLGQRTLEFTITRSGIPAPGALLCVRQDSAGGAVGDILYKFAEADSNGTVQMDVNIENDVPLRITATARNAMPDTANVPVGRDPDAPDVFYTDQQLLDGLDDGQGRARAGYPGRLRVSVENRGGAVADSVSGILAVRGSVTFNLKIDANPNDQQGLDYLPDHVFIGPQLRNPPKGSFTFQQLAMAGIEPNGAPTIPPSAWGYFVWRQTNDRKWYITCKGLGGELFVGDVRSSGGFKYVDDSGFDSGDTLRCDGGSCQEAEPRVVTFRAVADGADEDTISFEAGDFKNLLLTDWNEDFGDIPPDSTATEDFDLEILPDAEDGHEALMELEMVQEGHPVRFSLFTFEITAPKLTVVRQMPFFIPPDTVRLAIRVRNRGTADAENVTVRIENEQYATIIDGTRNLGRVPAGKETEAQNLKARFDIPHVADVRLRVTLENRYSGGGGETVSWTQSGVDIIPPVRSTALQAVPGPGGALITWLAPDRVPPVQPDSAVAGYNIYRREEGSNDRPRINDSLVVGSTIFYDDFSFDSFGGGMGLVEEWPYWYEVATVDSSWNETLSNATSTTLWLDELKGWPKQIDVGTEGSVLAEDIDADGDLEILHAGRAVFAWHHDGTEVVDGDQNAATDGVFFSDSTFSVLGDTLSLESGRRFMNDLAAWPGHLVVASSWGGRVYFWNPTGQLIGGPCNPCTIQGGGGFASPIIRDLDLNGNPEIIVTTQTGWLYRWTYNLQTRTIESSGSGRPDSLRLYADSFNYGGPSVANIDGDPDLEIIYATRSIRRVVALSDSLVPIWTCTLGGGGSPSKPTIADVDADAMEETVVAFGPNHVVVVDHTGVPLNGWPTSIGPLIGNGDRVPSPGVADILGDASPEIIVGDGRGGAMVNMNVYNLSGTSAAQWQLPYLRNYEYQEQGIRSPISLVNVDADSKLEVIHGTDLHHVVVWDSAGTPEPGWPIVVRESVRGKVTIADLDDVGKLEVVASDMAGVIHVWDYHDQMGIGIPAVPTAPSRDYLGLNRPNPFNPRTVIPFEISQHSTVSLRIYSSTGRLVRELESGVRDPGTYAAAWDGRDGQGVVLPSGIYLSELRIDGERVGARKLLLLR